MIARRAALALGLPAAVIAMAAAFARPIAVTRVADVNAALSPDSVSGLRHHRAQLALSMNLGTTGKLLASYTAKLTWDSTVVRLDSVRAGDFLAPAVNFVNAGEVRLTQATSTGQGGAVTLARLFFRVVSDDSTKRTVIQPTFTEVTATDFTNLMTSFAATGTVVRSRAPRVPLGFTPDSLYERVGHKPRIDLTADLTNVANVALGSYAASVTWDSTVMRLDSAVGSFGDFAHTLPKQGDLRVTGANAQGSTGVVTLAKLYFSFQGSAFPRTGTMALAVTELNAALTFANLLPGAAPKSGRVVIGGVLRGDIDVSGTVAALDAQKILEAVVGLSPTLPAGAQAAVHGDADCNGSARARDAQIVLNQIVGNDVSGFCVARIQ